RHPLLSTHSWAKTAHHPRSSHWTVMMSTSATRTMRTETQHALGSTRALRTHHFRIHHRSLWAKTTHWSDCRSLRATSSHPPRSNISSMRPKTAHHSWTSHWTVMMSTATTRSMW